MTDIITSMWTDYEAKLKARFAALRPQLLKALQTAGVASVTVEYDGEGDSGQVNSVEASDAAGNAIDLKQIRQPATADGNEQDKTLDELLDAFCWDALAVHHSGFEDNDGGFGRFTIDVATGAIELEHNERFVDYTTLVEEI